LKNPSNLKPAERLDEIMELSHKFGVCFIVSYFLTELAENASHSSFDDKCYWKDVLMEYDNKIKYEN